MWSELQKVMTVWGTFNPNALSDYRVHRERDGEAFSWSNLFLFRIDASREREKPRRQIASWPWPRNFKAPLKSPLPRPRYLRDSISRERIEGHILISIMIDPIFLRSYRLLLSLTFLPSSCLRTRIRIVTQFRWMRYATSSGSSVFFDELLLGIYENAENYEGCW